MTSDPVTISPEATSFQAARLMYNHKLTGLLVVEDGGLVGIITLADVLRLFVEVMGLLQDSSRFEVILKPDAHSLRDIHGIIRDFEIDVISVALIASSPDERVYSFRLDAVDPKPVLDALVQAGYEVYD
jgi:acetoin utilization protein AcuB